MHRFLVLLPHEHGRIIEDLEVDIRDINETHPGVSRDWTQYLSWSEGIWAKKLGSLKDDAPAMKVLRLNFEAWPKVSMSRRHLWDILRRLLSNINGLEKVVVVGSTKGMPMAKREPWSPVHFVGSDDVWSDDLVELMSATVGQPDEDKLIRWTRSNGAISLEVVSKVRLRKRNRLWVGKSTAEKSDGSWPENGSCSLIAYQQRYDQSSSNSETNTFSPNVFV